MGNVDMDKKEKKMGCSQERRKTGGSGTWNKENKKEWH